MAPVASNKGGSVLVYPPLTSDLEDSQRPAGFHSEAFPLRNLVMHITEACNLRCDYCYIQKTPRVMNRQVAEQSVRFLFDHAPEGDDPLSITFFGGEPLLEPGLIEYIHALASQQGGVRGREVTFGMTTNATLITAQNAQMIKRLGISVRLSLDGVGDAHDRHRRTISGKGSFDLIRRQLGHIAEIESVSVRLTVSPDTAAQLPASIQWLSDHGFNSISFSPVTEAEWSEESLAQLLEAQQQLYRIQNASDGVKISHIGKTERALAAQGPRWGCGAARGFVAVDPEGYLYPCHRFVGYFRNGETQRVGHVARGFDIQRREYYLAANHSSARQGCGHGMFSPEVPDQEKNCQQCQLLPVCGSNCMAVSEYMTGDPTRPHPVNRLFAQIDAATHLDAVGNS